MGKKYKVVKCNGVKVAKELVKDKDRPLMPPPVITHASKKDYSSRKCKRETRRMVDEYYGQKKSF